MPESVTLCVDANDDARRELMRALSEEPSVTVLAASSVEEAKATLAETAVDCVVTEHDLPDGNGLDLVAWLREVSPATWCLLYTDERPLDIEERAGDAVLTDYVAKGDEHALAVVVRLARAAGAAGDDPGYPLLPDDAQRVVVLGGLEVDADPLHSALERVTTLAATHFGVDDASINLVGEDTQEFSVQHAGEWHPIPRSESICTYSIVRPEGVTVVEDAWSDPRFRNNDTLRDFGIRFYAGATISVDGLPVGTLCVYDDETRTFSTEDRNYLRALAETAESLVTFYNRDQGE